jgi:hypothetical protein
VTGISKTKITKTGIVKSGIIKIERKKQGLANGYNFSVTKLNGL